MRRLAPGVAVLASLAAASPADADIIATFDTGDPVSQLRSVNAVTGAIVSLPPGVNDPSASQIHPELSPDGRFLVFLRRTSGTVRILMVERATGRAADLFNAFEAASDEPLTPTFSVDGTKVLTGRRLDRRDPNSPPDALQSSITETDVTNFPTGPFPHRIVLAGGLDSTAAGITLQPVAFGSNRLAFGISYSIGTLQRITVQGNNGATTLVDPAHRFANPAVSQSAGVVVFEFAPQAVPFTPRLAFRSLAGFATAPTIELPVLVNPRDFRISNPVFSQDGRYLGFSRRPISGGESRIYVWDTQTQLLLNPEGVPGLPSFPSGGIALEVRRVFTTTTLASGSAGFTLSQSSSTGLLVQRILGRQRLLGRTAPRLGKPRRIPLGRFRRGHHRTRWALAVNGHALRRGCYLVTFRALTRKRQVRDLSTPYTVRLGASGRATVSKGIRLKTCHAQP